MLHLLNTRKRGRNKTSRVVPFFFPPLAVSVRDRSVQAAAFKSCSSSIWPCVHCVCVCVCVWRLLLNWEDDDETIKKREKENLDKWWRVESPPLLLRAQLCKGAVRSNRSVVVVVVVKFSARARLLNFFCVPHQLGSLFFIQSDDRHHQQTDWLTVNTRQHPIFKPVDYRPLMRFIVLLSFPPSASLLLLLLLLYCPDCRRRLNFDELRFIKRPAFVAASWRTLSHHTRPILRLLMITFQIR